MLKRSFEISTFTKYVLVEPLHGHGDTYYTSWLWRLTASVTGTAAEKLKEDTPLLFKSLHALHKKTVGDFRCNMLSHYHKSFLLADFYGLKGDPEAAARYLGEQNEFMLDLSDAETPRMFQNKNFLASVKLFMALPCVHHVFTAKMLLKHRKIKPLLAIASNSPQYSLFNCSKLYLQ
ncbi:hypothetical protein BDR26DRAFT_58480 [Obelidium mucronatum]|nr:hypothetical protein BDR26DRAFT_58480 [Obelidium mucronatum]